jgi:hypothetical protein
MAAAKDFRKIALSLDGASEAPHFERTAFRARRIFATLAPDGRSANIRFPLEEQEIRCEAQPEAYRPIPNKWGAAGWTHAELSALTVDDLKSALTSAWRYQNAPKKSLAKRSR